MRGVKIGTKRTTSTKGMGIFEMAKKKDGPEDAAADAQKAQEVEVKSEMTNESLGIK